MNGIEKIIQRIDADTQAQIDSLTAAAQQEAQKLTAAYQAQADQLAAELAAQNEKAAQEREERLVSVTQLEARKVTLAAKQEMVELAFETALEKLRALPEAECVQVAAKLLAAAAPDGRGEAVFAPEDRERIGRAAVEQANALLGAKGALTLSEETRPTGGGVILKSGKVEVNCTFGTLVRLQKAECAGEAAHRLFPDT